MLRWNETYMLGLCYVHVADADTRVYIYNIYIIYLQRAHRYVFRRIGTRQNICYRYRLRICYYFYFVTSHSKVELLHLFFSARYITRIENKCLCRWATSDGMQRNKFRITTAKTLIRKMCAEIRACSPVHRHRQATAHAPASNWNRQARCSITQRIKTERKTNLNLNLRFIVCIQRSLNSMKLVEIGCC